MHIDEDGYINYVVDDLAISPDSNKVLEKVWERNDKEKIYDKQELTSNN